MALACLLGGVVGCLPEPKPHDQSKRRSPEPKATTAPRSESLGGIDPQTGLIRARGWSLVAAHCVACHSTQQFLRTRADRRTWEDAITWMQKSQGLWPIPDDARTTILDYLSTHYGPDSVEQPGRRPPLPPELMPPDPYATIGDSK